MKPVKFCRAVRNIRVASMKEFLKDTNHPTVFREPMVLNFDHFGTVVLSSNEYDGSFEISVSDAFERVMGKVFSSIYPMIPESVAFLRFLLGDKRLNVGSLSEAYQLTKAALAPRPLTIGEFISVCSQQQESVTGAMQRKGTALTQRAPLVRDNAWMHEAFSQKEN